jgi:hypothetical protein
LEHVAVRYPVVLLKHGIASDPQLNATSLLQLAIASSKVVQAAYGHAEFAGQYNPALESASALSELLTYWLVKAESAVTHSISRFELEIDGYDWLNVSGPRELLSRFDKHGLRAMLSTLRHICNVSTLSGDAGEGELLIAGIGNLSSGAESAIRELAVWSDIEIVIQKDSMTLRPGGLSE